MAQDPYYKKCCLTGTSNEKIDWHHVWRYGGSQINEAWAIMPIWWRKHSPYGDKDSVHNCRETKEQVELLSLQRATVEDLAKYPRVDWENLKQYFKSKYG